MSTQNLDKCMLCPRKCGVNRKDGEKGFCGAGEKIKIARSGLHYWEEPCISGKNGSGAVFFSHCTLKCVFCQNYEISAKQVGYEISCDELADIFAELEESGANNINLVTPTHFVPEILDAIEKARKKGLKLPFIYNCGGYENIDTVKMLDGYIDVFLPDVKYFDDKYALRYSKAENYFEIAFSAVKQMFEQVGECQFDKNGIIKKGVIVRHMLLPGLLLDSKKIVDKLFDEFGNRIYYSLMSQYTPLDTLPEMYAEIKKHINERAYNALIDYAANIGVENAFVQDCVSASADFIPDFFDSAPIKSSINKNR